MQYLYDPFGIIAFTAVAVATLSVMLAARNLLNGQAPVTRPVRPSVPTARKAKATAPARRQTSAAPAVRTEATAPARKAPARKVKAPKAKATAPATVNSSGSTRLESGGLRDMAVNYLALNAGQSFTPGKIAAALGGRSSGAVRNALARLATDTDSPVTQTSDQPIMFAVPAGTAPADTTPQKTAPAPASASRQPKAKATRSNGTTRKQPKAKAPKATAPATVNAASGTARLQPGDLRDMAVAYLTDNAGESFTPGKIATALGGRSSGAVRNALERLANDADSPVRQTSTTPLMFAVPAGTAPAPATTPAPADTTPEETAPAPAPAPRQPKATAPARKAPKAKAPKAKATAPADTTPDQATDGPSVAEVQGQLANFRKENESLLDSSQPTYDKRTDDLYLNAFQVLSRGNATAAAKALDKLREHVASIGTDRPRVNAQNTRNRRNGK